MGLATTLRTTAKRLLIAGHSFPQQCDVGMREPQSEIAVELHGLGAPTDVTNLHMPASPAPITVVVGVPRGLEAQRGAVAELQFRERAGNRRLLGRLGLRLREAMSLGEGTVGFFAIRCCRNYCLPWSRLRARYLQMAYDRWRRPPEIPVAAADVHAMVVCFICPRPVALVSVCHGAEGSLFPMNLMGPLGGGYFGFALNRTRAVSALVQRAGRVALSSVPIDRAAQVRELGRNHRRDRIEWGEIPFPLQPSAEFGFPIPAFAGRVRELELLDAREMGSHRLFLARVVRDEARNDDPRFFTVHGIYQCSRRWAAG